MAEATNDGAAENVVCVGDMQRSVIPIVVFVTFVNGINMDGDGLVPYLEAQKSYSVVNSSVVLFHQYTLPSSS